MDIPGLNNQQGVGAGVAAIRLQHELLKRLIALGVLDKSDRAAIVDAAVEGLSTMLNDNVDDARTWLTHVKAGR